MPQNFDQHFFLSAKLKKKKSARSKVKFFSFMNMLIVAVNDVYINFLQWIQMFDKRNNHLPSYLNAAIWHEEKYVLTIFEDRNNRLDSTVSVLLLSHNTLWYWSFCFALFYGKEREKKKKFVIDRNHLFVGDYDYTACRYDYTRIILCTDYD